MTRAKGLSGSFWPSPAQEGLLRLALAREERVPELWRALQPLRVEALEIGSLCLLPLAFARLGEAGVEDERLPRLKGAYQSVWYRNQLLLDRLAPVLDELRAAGVEPLVLGGAAVATGYYPQLALRPIAQLELAVAGSEAPAASSALERLGWRRSGGGRGQTRVVSGDGAVVAVFHAGAPRFFAGPLGPDRAFAALRARSVERPVGSAPARVLDPGDELLLACGLGARRTLPQNPQWLVDTQRILAAAAPDPSSLAARAAELRLVPALRDTLRYLARVSETLEPSPWLEAVRPLPVSRRDAFAHALAGAGRGRFGAPPSALVAHARATAAEPLPRALAGLPRAFREAWGVENGRRLAGVALRRAAGRVRGGRGAVAQPSGALESRNRSASSRGS